MSLNTAQSAFVHANADIVAFCAPRGAGKTYSLLAHGFDRVTHERGFNGLIVQRQKATYMMQALHCYRTYSGNHASNDGPAVNMAQSRLSWVVQGSKMYFTHMGEHDRTKFQGMIFDYVGIDDLSFFTPRELLFFHERARGRGKPVSPSVRVTFTPDLTEADAWPYQFFAPWFDSTLPLLAQSGEKRAFLRHDNEIEWLPKGTAHAQAISATVILPPLVYKPLIVHDEAVEFTQEQMDYVLNHYRVKASHIGELA